MRRHLYKVNVACVALAGWLAFDLAMAEANGPVNGVGGELTSRGVVRARAEAVIATDLNARIVALPFRKGDRFKKGDTLVEFDCRRYKSRTWA